MIIYNKLNLTLIGLEIRVGNQVKVFVNPYEYVFEETDHWGYVINGSKPDFIDLNNINLDRDAAENYYIMHHLNKRET